MAKKLATNQKAATANATGISNDLYGVVSGSASTAPTVTDYTPINSLTPTANPSAWGITDPNANIYVGDAAPSIKPGTYNQILGAIADHLGIKPQKGVSLQELVEGALTKQLGITKYVAPLTGPITDAAGTERANFGGKKPKKQAVADTNALNSIMHKLGVALPFGPIAQSNTAALWGSIAKKLGVPIANVTPSQPQMKNILQVAGGINNMTRDQLTQFQNLLYEGGFYGPGFVDGTQGSGKNSYTAGQKDQATMNAWGNLLNQTAAANKAGNNVSWLEYLQDQISGSGNFATALGTGADSSSTTPKVTVATSDQLNNPAIAAFEQLLGRKPSDAEIQELTKQYDAQQQAKGDASAAASEGQPFATDSSGVDVVAGVPSEADAAANFARNSDPIQYLAHGMANAGATISNIIAGTGASPTDGSNVTQ